MQHKMSSTLTVNEKLEWLMKMAPKERKLRIFMHLEHSAIKYDDYVLLSFGNLLDPINWLETFPERKCEKKKTHHKMSSTLTVNEKLERFPLRLMKMAPKERKLRIFLHLKHSAIKYDDYGSG
ncbi:hypothetical protein CEXT_584061 [Caerostris extrusa]|uniref:Uncharacterized protein n=1 Tax=Caerostris extrusa TaxID=172846 RepID=A0AAV4SLB0_CAEEX|nr:hypothetical protein CEXT_584061 [Caerostris extrusa]